MRPVNIELPHVINSNLTSGHKTQWFAVNCLHSEITTYVGHPRQLTMSHSEK